MIYIIIVYCIYCVCTVQYIHHIYQIICCISCNFNSHKLKALSNPGFVVCREVYILKYHFCFYLSGGEYTSK